MKQLGLQGEFNIETDFVFGLTFATRENVWKFWEAKSEESTLTTQLAKFCVTDKPKCQQDLQYPSTVGIVTKPNCHFYQNI